MHFRSMTGVFFILASGCTAGSTALEPMPGSITYGGHVARMTKSPIGTTVPHEFYDQFGNWVQETYVVEPDRTLKLARREIGQQTDR